MQDIGSLQLASIQEALSVDHFSVTVQECVKGSGSPSLLILVAKCLSTVLSQSGIVHEGQNCPTRAVERPW